MLLCAHKGKPRQSEAEKTEKPSNELVRVEFALHAQRLLIGSDFVPIAINVFGDEAVLTRVNVEFKVVGPIFQHSLVSLLVLVAVRISSFCFLHLFAQRIIRAVLLLDDVNSDVDDVRGWRLIDRHGQTHGNIEHVFAINGNSPHQADVFLSRLTESVIISGKRHGKQSEAKQDGRYTKVEKHVPSSFLQSLFALIEGHFLQAFILVLIHDQCPCCVEFLFGHKSPISSEHFKTAGQ